MPGKKKTQLPKPKCTLSSRRLVGNEPFQDLCQPTIICVPKEPNESSPSESSSCGCDEDVRGPITCCASDHQRQQSSKSRPAKDLKVPGCVPICKAAEVGAMIDEIRNCRKIIRTLAQEATDILHPESSQKLSCCELDDDSEENSIEAVCPAQPDRQKSDCSKKTCKIAEANRKLPCCEHGIPKAKVIEVTCPVCQAKPIEPTCPVCQPKPKEPICPVCQAKPIEPTCTVCQAKPIDPTYPVCQPKLIEPTCPVCRPKPKEPICPVCQAKPIEPTCPVCQPKPIEPTCPVCQEKPIDPTCPVCQPKLTVTQKSDCAKKTCELAEANKKLSCCEPDDSKAKPIEPTCPTCPPCLPKPIDRQRSDSSKKKIELIEPGKYSGSGGQSSTRIYPIPPTTPPKSPILSRKSSDPIAQTACQIKDKRLCNNLGKKPSDCGCDGEKNKKADCKCDEKLGKTDSFMKKLFGKKPSECSCDGEKKQKEICRCDDTMMKRKKELEKLENRTDSKSCLQKTFGFCRSDTEDEEKQNKANRLKEKRNSASVAAACTVPECAANTCTCHFPPAYNQYFNCTGHVSGNCNCAKHA